MSKIHNSAVKLNKKIFRLRHYSPLDTTVAIGSGMECQQDAVRKTKVDVRNRLKKTIYETFFIHQCLVSIRQNPWTPVCRICVHAHTTAWEQNLGNGTLKSG